MHFYLRIFPVFLLFAMLPGAGAQVVISELGFYLPSGGFGSRSSMLDYVNWGTSSGVRDNAAVGAPAIWVLDTAIDISGMVAGDTIQLKLDAPGNAIGDYEINRVGNTGDRAVRPDRPAECRTHYCGWVR